jgi:DNA invertase Pin-like site-specific DNA recombinase
VKAVIVAKLDRLTRSGKDLCELLERASSRRGVALVSVAESLDTGSVSTNGFNRPKGGAFSWYAAYRRTSFQRRSHQEKAEEKGYAKTQRSACNHC